jgi:bla regulator protein blaR1
MIIFFIKSTVCLTVLYGFYHFFLHSHKVLLFNRVYLVSSLFFSVITSLILIPVKSNYLLNNSFDKISSATGYFIKGNSTIVNSYSLFTFQNILFPVFVVMTSFLMIRFALNIFRLLSKIKKNKKVDYQKTSLVLIKERTLPYSFFKYIFVNRSDYENGKIEKELLIHEEAHCLQYHSIDIIIIEFLNVFLWFNPAIWLFKKAILLILEFLADNNVLTTFELDDYQNTLLNLVLKNNSASMASNFNYSLTKKRLIMMNKKTNKERMILRKISIIPLFLILLVTLAFAQENLMNGRQGANHKETAAGAIKSLTLDDEQKAVLEEQSLSFQEKLSNERKAASKEQTPSFQEGLTKERKAADEEQTPSFQERLAKERKAAEDGTIVVSKK